MSEYKLRFSSLDKNDLKADFIDYLKTTSEFQNFNFTASGMASILDLLSYNAYYQSLMANFQFNEVFLDTASKRQNIVSRASELGYVPYSRSAAKATLTVTVTNVSGSPSSLVLPTGSSFFTTVNNQSYNFVTLYPYSTNVQYDTLGNPFYTFSVAVYDGILSQNTFTLGLDPSIDIPTLEMDTNTLRVFVSINNIEYEFYAPGNFLSVAGTNKVFFLNESFNTYRITFGDNIFGSLPPQGSIVRCTYLVTGGGDGANGSSVFSFSSTIPGSPTALVSVTTVSASAGGADSEDTDSIKTNAVGAFKSQDRAVTPSDYKSVILAASSNIKDVIVWGGENNTPPLFGKIVACIQPKYGDVLTLFEKSNIQAVVASKAVTNVGVVFKDPQYINIVVDSNITYDIQVITKPIYDLEALIKSTIAAYINTNLSKFDGKLRYSNLTSIIDRVDSSILSNYTKIMLKKKYYPTLYQNIAVNFSFNNSLDNENKSYSVRSTLFYVKGITAGVWVEDDSAGNLNLYYSKDGVKTYAGYNVGTINYVTGALTIASIFITGVDGVSIDFTAAPAEQDLMSVFDTIIKIDSNDILIKTIKNS